MGAQNKHIHSKFDRVFEGFREFERELLAESFVLALAGGGMYVHTSLRLSEMVAEPLVDQAEIFRI